MATKLENHVDFNGPQWAALKQWLTEQEATKISQMLGAENTDTMYELRGAVKLIRFLLSVETTARKQAVNQG